MDKRDVVRAAEHIDDLFALVSAHQACININTCELVADCFVQQDGSD